MLRGLSPDLRDKIVNTYTDLVEEERQETQKAIGKPFSLLVHPFLIHFRLAAIPIFSLNPRSGARGLKGARSAPLQ